MTWTQLANMVHALPDDQKNKHVEVLDTNFDETFIVDDKISIDEYTGAPRLSF